jgi:hypothetical protein
VLKFTPAAINFGLVAIGEDPSQTVTVTNTSGLPTAIQTSVLSGGFKLRQNTCPPVLAGMGSCTYSIQFMPGSVTSADNGTLTVTEGSGAQIVASITGQPVAVGN